MLYKSIQMDVGYRTKNGMSPLGGFRQNRAARRLFTARQIQILDKILNMESLTGTEGEMYSRTLKPRINAIIDFYPTAILLRDKS